MKILFLCGSLELGHDGVGDYVRLLAEELKRQGHQAGAIALYDTHIEDIFNTGWLIKDELPTLRLPSCWPARRRFQHARQWTQGFQPTWVSLQFVPYAFHPKGLPSLLSWHLRSIVKGRRIHLMMHETWVGTESGVGLKRRLLSLIQKVLIKNILTELAPAVIHTHLPVYRTSLQSLGWNASPLPVFSNIPVSLAAPEVLEPGMFRIGLFSQIDTSNTFTDFLIKLVEHVVRHKLRCEVLLIGGQPSKMETFKVHLESKSNLHGRVHYTGFLDSAQLSAVLQTCHLGLTPIPQHGLGKSGTVAAFLAHGIPVAAPISFSAYNTSGIGFFSEDLSKCIILQPTLSGLQDAQKSIFSAKSTIYLSTVVSTFIEDLSKA
jgi:glycosyltransferase involved in cell wall biosynthesis